MSGDGIGAIRLRRRAFLAGSAGLAAAGLVAGGDARAAMATAPATLRVQRLAWAGIRLQLPAATLFIDPLIDPQAWGAALKDTLVPVDDAVGETQVLITHAHPDHYDARAVIAALAKGGVIAYPEGTRPLALPPEVRARPSPLWEPQLLGDFTATPVPAADGYGDLQVSWVVSAGGRRIFHGGDTLWHGHWWRVGRQFGPFDVAFLPVNGARFGWRKPVSGQPGVLTPEQALAAARILGARRLVPIHYGVTGLAEYTEVDDPIGSLRAQAREYLVEGRAVDVQVVQPGGWVEWRG